MTETGSSFAGRKKFEGPGGTPGGLGEVLVGLLMVAIGVYIVFDHVTVHTSFWRFMGSPGTSFGMTMLPLLIGVGVLFFNGASKLGWFLTVAGVALILVGVLMNLDIYFRPTSLWATIVMFGLDRGWARGVRARLAAAHAKELTAPPARAGTLRATSKGAFMLRFGVVLGLALWIGGPAVASRAGAGAGAADADRRWIWRRSPRGAGPTTRW